MEHAKANTHHESTGGMVFLQSNFSNSENPVIFTKCPNNDRFMYNISSLSPSVAANHMLKCWQM